MRTMNSLLLVGVLSVFAAGAAGAQTASRYDGTAAARAAVKAGDAARGAGQTAQAIAHYRKAVALDPDYANAQFDLANALGYQHATALSQSGAPVPEAKMQAAVKQDAATRAGLVEKFAALSKQHPDNAIYPWLVGQLVQNQDPARGEAGCERSVRIDPRFVNGWGCLGQIAMLRGDQAKALADLKRATDLAPRDEMLADQYAEYLGMDTTPHVAELTKLAGRFPDSNTVAAMLSNAAGNVEPASATIAALERLLRDPPGGGKMIGLFAANGLYPLYVEHDLAKAPGFATARAKVEAAEPRMAKMWQARAAYAQGLIDAGKQLAANDAHAALATLAAHKPAPEFDTGVSNQWYLLNAKALRAGGQAGEAFASLIRWFAADPNIQTYTALQAYGPDLHLSHAQVDDAVWKALHANAKPAAPFTLDRLDNDQPTSLASFRGKPVILDFWFPSCQGCRMSFPYLQKLAVKYNPQGVHVLAINSLEDQQAFALPFLRGNRYDFIGLAGNNTFAQEKYGVMGYPTTLLIGADGMIYASLRVEGESGQRTAEVLIGLLLAHAKA